ncbi:hypothetical protein BH09MYX1_BH09MYX1_35410 [soil metagenome]
MTRLRFGLAVVASISGVIAACATATTSSYVSPDDAGTGNDASTVDGSACPELDLQTDPKHCGTCTNACGSTQVCSAGVCKAQCDPPTVKCSGGTTCVDTTKDSKNCGTCGTSCDGPDGGPEGGTGNPDAGVPIPDGGFDAGNGWTLSTPACANSKCDFTCSGGTTLCTDKLCWDTQNAHEHCGSCGTGCAASTEWCNQGHCCATGTQWCGSACVSTVNDGKNCGACGNVCPNNLPACVNGTCKAQIAVTTVCQKVNPSGILCSGNCSVNDAQYADAYCKLAGYNTAVSYNVLSASTVQCIYYNTQNVVPTQCSQIIGPVGYGLNNTCHAIQNLICQ